MEDVENLSVGEVKEKSQKSLKWSFLGEIFAKLAAPLSTMILARLLAPAIYGIATAVTIVVSFCETVAESGFAKYLIQKDFKTEDEYKKSISVALIFSLFLSIIGCAVIYFARVPLSKIVGNSGYEMVLVASSLQIPFAAVNAIFAATLRRKFNFQFLFFVRILSCLPPFLVSIPLAFIGLEHWSLVIGGIATIAIQTPVLIFACRKHLMFYFSFRVLKEMFVFSFAMIIESLIIWFCSWSTIFLAANFFDSTGVGLIKVSATTVNSIFNLFSIPFISVLFPTLSRLKDNKEEFEKSFIEIHSVAVSILVPIGIGGFFYGNFIVSVLLGSAWGDATNLVAMMCLSNAVAMSTGYLLSEVFRAKGHYVYSILFQVLMLGLSILFHLVMGKHDMLLFVSAGLITYSVMLVVCFVIMKFIYHFALSKILLNYLIAIVCSSLMIPITFILKKYNSNNFVAVLKIVLCAITYFGLMALLFRKRFKLLLSFVFKKNKKSLEQKTEA